MKLYFLRHADAREGADAAARPLSPHGRKEALEVGRFLKRAGIEFDAAYSSPLVRAKETAEIVLDACGPTKLELTAALLNDLDVPTALAIAEESGGDAARLVLRTLALE